MKKALILMSLILIPFILFSQTGSNFFGLGYSHQSVKTDYDEITTQSLGLEFGGFIGQRLGFSYMVFMGIPLSAQLNGSELSLDAMEMKFVMSMLQGIGFNLESRDMLITPTVGIHFQDVILMSGALSEVYITIGVGASVRASYRISENLYVSAGILGAYDFMSIIETATGFEVGGHIGLSVKY